MTYDSVGLGVTGALTLIAVGCALYILRVYTVRMQVTKYDRRSGLLPAHVSIVSAWAIAVCLRMMLSDQYVSESKPPWLGWPLTAFLVLWLIVALAFLVKMYRGSRGPRLRG